LTEKNKAINDLAKMVSDEKEANEQSLEVGDEKTS